MTRTAQYAKSTANLCPLCLAVPETQDHIFCCSSPDAIQHRVPAWHRCLETIRTKGKTSRHILDAFDSGSSLFLQLPPRPIPFTTFPVPAIISPSLSSAQEVQHEIGWKNLFRGFFSRTWGATQELYTQHIEKPAGNWTLDNWKRITAAAFLEFGHSLWKFRNDTKFGKDKLEHARIVRTQLEFKVSAQYSSKRYLLPKFHHIFSKPLAEWLRQGNQALSAWLRHLASYSEISAHSLEHGGRQRDFRSYLNHLPGSTPPRYLDVAAERALCKCRKASVAVPKVIRKVRKARKKSYPQPHPNPAAHITRSHYHRHTASVITPLRLPPLVGFSHDEIADGVSTHLTDRMGIG